MRVEKLVGVACVCVRGGCSRGRGLAGGEWVESKEGKWGRETS